MKHKIDEVALNNLNLALKFIVEGGHSGIISDVEIQLDKNLDFNLRSRDFDLSTSMGRMLHSVNQVHYRDATKFPETLEALKKLLASDYFAKLEKELKCDKIGLVINPASDSVDVSLGHDRNEISQKILFWVQKKFKVDIQYDEIFYRWTDYGEFSAERGLETDEQIKAKSEARAAELKTEPKTAEEILNETLKGK